MKITDPDCWTKGDDYTKEQIYEKHPSLKSIMLINNVPDKSTTSIIEKILS
jgi:bifunctional ADP-heptose synthase (sugar kinase/adenylyltransferase)